MLPITALALTARIVGASVGAGMGAAATGAAARLGWMALIFGNLIRGVLDLPIANLTFYGGGWLFIALAAIGAVVALAGAVLPRRR